MHGYGIGASIEQITGGIFTVNAGSLFPAFRRLEGRAHQGRLARH
jgi:PadR family transcriptional regulator, regulatory protein PadR